MTVIFCYLKKSKLQSFEIISLTLINHLPHLSTNLQYAPQIKALKSIKHRGRLLEEVRLSSRDYERKIIPRL